MLNELFGRGDYYDFPSFEVALYSLLLSFILSTIIGQTYKFTYEEDRFPRHFFQASVLSSTVTSMVIMAVGNNIAAGFGISGAVAIIRFCTLVRDPRNIIFIFASLSVGIATGVYGYAIAIAGTLIFCVVALLLHYSPFGASQKRYFDLSFSSALKGHIHEIESVLDNQNIKYKIIRYRKLDQDLGFRYTIRIILMKVHNEGAIFQNITALTGFTDVLLIPSEEVQL